MGPGVPGAERKAHGDGPGGLKPAEVAAFDPRNAAPEHRSGQIQDTKCGNPDRCREIPGRSSFRRYPLELQIILRRKLLGGIVITAVGWML